MQEETDEGRHNKTSWGTIKLILKTLNLTKNMDPKHIRTHTMERTSSWMMDGIHAVDRKVRH